MTEKTTQQPLGVASDLNAELDVVNNNMMCFWVNDTEISHYLRMHINDQENLTYEQKHACIDASFVIDELRREVVRLAQKYKTQPVDKFLNNHPMLSLHGSEVKE